MSGSTLAERVNRLEIRQSEQGSALWGDDRTRDNGLRSHVREHEDRLDTLECADREHRDTRKDLDAHLKAHAQMDAATTTLAATALQVRGATRAAIASSAGSILVGIGAVLAVVLK